MKIYFLSFLLSLFLFSITTITPAHATYTDVIYIDQAGQKARFQVDVTIHKPALHVSYGGITTTTQEKPVWENAYIYDWFLVQKPALTFKDFRKNTHISTYGENPQLAKVIFQKRKELFPTPQTVKDNKQAQDICCRKVIGTIFYKTSEHHEYAMVQYTPVLTTAQKEIYKKAGITGPVYQYDFLILTDGIWKRFIPKADFPLFKLDLPIGGVKFHQDWITSQSKTVQAKASGLREVVK